MLQILLILLLLSACAAQPSLDDTNRYAFVMTG
jgi:hypothetical protein